MNYKKPKVEIIDTKPVKMDIVKNNTGDLIIKILDDPVKLALYLKIFVAAILVFAIIVVFIVNNVGGK